MSAEVGKKLDSESGNPEPQGIEGNDANSPYSSLSQDAKSVDGTASVFSTAVSITLNVIGGGMLAIPVSFDQSSLVPGVVLLLLMATMSVYSMFLLTFAAERSHKYSYKDLLTTAFSEKAGKAFEFVLAFYTSAFL